jgi:hypothetical protein
LFGYKIFDKSYYAFNYFIAIVGFSIYLAYYISEQKTKRVDVYSLFVMEYLNICWKWNNSEKFISKIIKELFVKYLNMNYFNIIVSQMSLYLFYKYIAS